MSLPVISAVFNTTYDAEVKATTSGRNVLNVGLAANKRRKDRDDYTLFARAEWWEPESTTGWADDLAAALPKGARVFVRGEIRTDTYTTRTGEQRQVTFIMAHEIVPIPSPSKEGHTAPKQASDSDPWGGGSPSFGSGDTEPPF